MILAALAAVAVLAGWAWAPAPQALRQAWAGWWGPPARATSWDELGAANRTDRPGAVFTVTFPAAIFTAAATPEEVASG
jgi:hypothetical protein